MKKICEDSREYFSKKLQEIKTDQSIFNSSYREKFINYLIEGEELFKEIQDENYCDLIVRLYQRWWHSWKMIGKFSWEL